jgi:hypothetical protein
MYDIYIGGDNMKRSKVQNDNLIEYINNIQLQHPNDIFMDYIEDCMKTDLDEEDIEYDDEDVTYVKERTNLPK